jgi:hypothetical protein
MSAISAEDGLAYRVRYAFSHDPKKWKFSATFKDPNTGEPVADTDRAIPGADLPVPLPQGWPIDNKVTKQEFPIFETQDFSLLELPF